MDQLVCIKGENAIEIRRIHNGKLSRVLKVIEPESLPFAVPDSAGPDGIQKALLNLLYSGF